MLVIWERKAFPYFFSAFSTATETAALLPIPKKPAFSQNKEHVHHFNRMCFLNRPHRISGRVRAHNRSVDFTGKPCVLGLHGFRATPHNSARSLSRDFYPNAKSPRRRNALCQRQPQSVYRSVSRAASRSASKDRIFRWVCCPPAIDTCPQYAIIQSGKMQTPIKPQLDKRLHFPFSEGSLAASTDHSPTRNCILKISYRTGGNNQLEP